MYDDAVSLNCPVHLLCSLKKYIYSPLTWCEVFPDGSTVKNLPAMQETQVGNLSQEDPLQKRMAIHYSILVWTIPWREEPGGLQSMASQRARHNWVPNTLLGVRWYFSVVLICIFLINDIEHLVMCLLAICTSYLEKYLFMTCAHFCF